MTADIKIDLSGLEKELRGIVHKYLGEILENFDIKKWINKKVNGWVKDTGNKIIQKKVYAYLEEAQLEVPSNFYNLSNKRITINDYIIKVIHDFAVNKAGEMLSKMEITLNKE